MLPGDKNNQHFMNNFSIIELPVNSLTIFYLDFNVSNLVGSSNDGPANQWRKNMSWEIGTGISDFDKLQSTG